MKDKYLLYQLVSRDISSRYLGSIVGVFWSILNPLVQLVLYTVVFSVVLQARFGQEDSTGRFAELLFCALLPWMALQEATTRSVRSFIEQSSLLKKVRFPLHLIPLSLVVSAIFHQLLGTLVFLLILLWNQNLHLVTFPLFVLLLLLQGVMMYGLSLAAASFNVFFRDLAQLVGVAFTLLFWVTPIVYPRSRVPEAFEWVLLANPLTHMVEAYRYVFFGEPIPTPIGVIYWAGCCVVALLAGRWVLKSTQRDLVDLV